MNRPPLQALPIDDVLADIVDAVARSPNLVLKAPTGAGKTTRVAPALLDVREVRGDVLLLEPRRVAARAAARRIALERGGAVGDEVGHHVRFDRKTGPKTKLVAMTTGIFLRRIQDDPFLDGVGAVVFDEFHERSLDVDLSLAMARKAQREAREDLRLLVMSATLDVAPVARFLGDATVLESAGRSFPVEIRHRAVEEDRTTGGNRGAAASRAMDFAVSAAVASMFAETEGDVLVFLPGVGEIRRIHDNLASRAATDRFDVVELYGDLAAEEQDAVLRRGPRRKVVLATNVAESSVTIENITAVVDTGLARVMRFDPSVGIDRLELGRISKASADQRSGRAGRTSPGICLRLWSAHEDRALRATEEPEVRRVDLARAVLELRAWGEPSARDFGWFEAPEVQALDAAETLLRELGALGDSGLTAIGRRLARLPLPPRIGRLLLEGEKLGVRSRAALAAAMLSERDPVRRSPGRRDDRHTNGGLRATTAHESDLLERVLLLERFAAASSRTPAAWPELSVGAAHSVLRVAKELAATIREADPTVRETVTSARDAPRDATPTGERGARSGNDRSAPANDGPTLATKADRPTSTAPRIDGDEAFLRALLAAFPDRVAQRRERGSDRAVMVGGRGLRLAPDSVVHSADLFVCVDVDAGRRGERAETLVRQASAVEREWLDATGLRRGIEVEFDAASESVVAFARSRWRDLVLEEKPAPTPRDAAGPLLAERAALNPERALDLGDRDVADFLARVRSLAAWMPDLALPIFDDEEIAGVARALALGRRSFEEMRRAPLLEALRARLTWEQSRALDRHAPERLEVPSGSSIRLQYEAGRAPVLAARIQEMFGLAETPRVGGGRVAVVVHLLAPNGRPQQVTEDLASFWRNTYVEVRKELRTRYPRHSWPEDPLTATPEKRPARKRH